MTLGEYVRAVMQEKGLSALAVQRNSNGAISDTYVLKIASGKAKRPSLSRLKALAKGLKQPEDEVLSFAGASGDRGWSAHRLAILMSKIVEKPEVGELVERLLEMKPEELKRVTKYLKKK